MKVKRRLANEFKRFLEDSDGEIFAPPPSKIPYKKENPKTPTLSSPMPSHVVQQVDDRTFSWADMTITVEIMLEEVNIESHPILHYHQKLKIVKQNGDKIISEAVGETHFEGVKKDTKYMLNSVGNKANVKGNVSFTINGKKGNIKRTLSLHPLKHPRGGSTSMLLRELEDISPYLMIPLTSNIVTIKQIYKCFQTLAV